MKAQVGIAAVLNAVVIVLLSGFLMYFLIPQLDTYRVDQIQYYQNNPDLFTPLMLMFLYILIPFIWTIWLFVGVFYIVRTAQSNRGVV
jgi:ABC-type dipeptide/oligopeptide/nickel transport system permease subunit